MGDQHPDGNPVGSYQAHAETRMFIPHQLLNGEVRNWEPMSGKVTDTVVLEPAGA
jgi:hypothetical protein